MAKNFEPCKICNSPGNGLHFGIDACRGCTSFFRRTIVQEKEYYCNSDDSCEIGKSEAALKSPCRKCRFAKCLEVGMKSEAVQKNRDSYGKRRELAIYAANPSPSSVRLKFPAPYFMLESVKNQYSHLESVRLVVHLDEGTSMFSKRIPKPHTFRDTDKLMFREYDMVTDWAMNSFPQLADFPNDQRKILLKHFYLQFFILESGFMACRNGRNDVWFLPNGDYIDCRDLASFYRDPTRPESSSQSISPEHAALMMKGTCTGCRRMVTNTMLKDNIDQCEFLALSALILFQTGLEGQSESCMETCKKIRSTVQRELLQYYAGKRTQEYSIRMGNVLSLLPSVLSSTYKMLDDMELMYIMNKQDHSFFKYFVESKRI